MGNKRSRHTNDVEERSFEHGIKGPDAINGRMNCRVGKIAIDELSF